MTAFAHNNERREAVRRSAERPQADYIGHPLMRNYRVEYVGPFKRPGLDGVWFKRMELWTENGRDCGAWRWERRFGGGER